MIIIPGAGFPEAMFSAFYSMLFHGNRDEMIIDLLGNKLGLTLEYPPQFSPASLLLRRGRHLSDISSSSLITAAYLDGVARGELPS